MAAARNIPMPDVLRTITIDATFTPTPQGIIVYQGEQIEFKNNSGFDIIVEFQHNPPGVDVYPNMNLPVANGATNSFTAPSANTSANYYIYQGATLETGPFVIQVGTGPMNVHLTENSGVVIYTPETVAVPLGNITTGMGTLEMISDIPNTGFNITWTGGEPFNPPLSSSGGAEPVKAGIAPGSYGYSAASNAHPASPGTRSRVAGGPGGKVIIQN